MRRQLALLVVAGLSVALLFGACNKCQEMIGARTVESPAEGTPEWVIQQAIAAAAEEDTDEGWRKIRPLLHSDLVASPASEKGFRTLNFEAFHRKYRLYLPDDKCPPPTNKCPGLPIYEIDYTEEVEQSGELTIFVVNEGSDMPTPCTVKPDSTQNNAWKIKRCSL